MLTLRAGRQPQRRAGTSGRSARRASENATKVPLSKKCKLDIKRKHLRAAIPGCLAVNSYAVNLQLQIDGERLPDLYKCTIKKHVNNKTSCVSYRLQGTGIYNHLRGLYMRGFSCAEDPGVVVLVASRQAAPDLSYSGQSEGEEGEDAGEVRVAVKAEIDSEAEKRQQRSRKQQRPRRQRKRRRDDSDEEDEEEGQFDELDDEEVAVEATLTGPSGRQFDPYSSHGQGLVLAAHQLQHPHQQPELHHQHRHQRIRSHPVQSLHPSPHDGGDVHVGLHAHALSGAGGDSATLLCDENADDDVVSALDVAGVAEDVAAAVAEVERRNAQGACGPGPGSSMLPVDPFDHIAIGVGLGVGLGGVGCLGDTNSILSSGVTGPACLLGPDGAGSSASAVVQLHDTSHVGGDGDGAGQHHAGAGLQESFHAHRDPLLDLPLTLSPFSPRLLQELTGRTHAPRGMGHQQVPQSANGWGPLPPLDFDTNYSMWPRQHLGWPDSLGLGLL